MSTTAQTNIGTIVYCAPGCAPETREVSLQLDVMQGLVGGNIERFHEHAGISFYCNEEGLLLNLPFNRYVGSHAHPIVGPIFACGTNEDEDRGLTADEVRESVAYLSRGSA